MSANFVDKTVIDLLLTAARKWPDGNEPWFYYWCRDGSHPVTDETADAVGRMLWGANWDATEGWAYEDGGETESPVPAYRYAELPGVPDPLVVLRAISYYGYQTAGDEVEEWLLSEPSAFLDRLAHTAWHKLPGMADVPWGFDDSHRDIFVTRS